VTYNCSHCLKPMPPSRDGREIAVGWTVMRVELHGDSTINVGYLYLCPNDMMATLPKQLSLNDEPHRAERYTVPATTTTPTTPERP